MALITTLLLLMLLTGLTLTMAWSARSDMLINGYYRNFRGAFYAADSGLNVVARRLLISLPPVLAFPRLLPPETAPILRANEATIADKLSIRSFADYHTDCMAPEQDKQRIRGQAYFKLPSSSHFS